MKRHIKYGSIDQFRNIIKHVTQTAQYIGQDEVTQKAKYNPLAAMPVINVSCTEKIHGTNGAVCYSNSDGFWVQSNAKIITPESDNAGCAFAATHNQDHWVKIIKDLAKEYDVDLDESIITVYFEWCGIGIHKHTALTGMSKRAMIFQHFKISPIEPQEESGEVSVWKETKIQETHVSNTAHDIYNICDFCTYEFQIDFANPLASQNALIDLVIKEIEPSSPVGEEFGAEGNIGEGIVATFTFKEKVYKFKVKGEKHAGKSKVKTLKPVDDVKLQKIQDVATAVTQVWRLEQMYAAANDLMNGGFGDVRNLGEYIRLVQRDIIKEESDVIAASGLIPKDIFKVTAHIAKCYFQQALDEEAFGE